MIRGHLQIVNIDNAKYLSHALIEVQIKQGQKLSIRT